MIGDDVRALRAARDINRLADLVRGPGNAQTRREALDALVELRAPEALTLGLQYADDPSVQVRAGAVAALGHFPGPRAEASLQRALRDPLLRNIALQSLHAIGSQPAAEEAGGQDELSPRPAGATEIFSPTVRYVLLNLLAAGGFLGMANARLSLSSMAVGMLAISGLFATADRRGEALIFAGGLAFLVAVNLLATVTAVSQIQHPVGRVTALSATSAVLAAGLYIAAWVRANVVYRRNVPVGGPRQKDDSEV